jgi:putative component of membrane protein insertase Oxa1/YidC/SpoIIIJ protein YidD
MRTAPSVIALLLAVLIRPVACEALDEAAHLARRAQLVRELLEEGAATEAIAEAEALVAEAPAATNALAGTAAERALFNGTREGVVEAFRTARDPRVFRVAGAALYLLFRSDKGFRKINPSLATQVEMSRDSWTRNDLADARECVNAIAQKKERRGPGAWLAAGVVGFYRLCVGPAIGDRCVLEPSCSRYYLEASRKHGILGVPMVADRFVREPVESNSGRRIRMPDGSWRHPDPVSDHDWWFSKEAK